MPDEKAMRLIAVCGDIFIPIQTALGNKPNSWLITVDTAVKKINKLNNVDTMLRVPLVCMAKNNVRDANKNAALLTGDIGRVCTGGSLSKTINQVVVFSGMPTMISRIVSPPSANKIKQQTNNITRLALRMEYKPKPQAMMPIAVL